MTTVHHEQLARFPDAHEAYRYGVEHEDLAEAPYPEELANYWGAVYDTSADVRETDGVFGVMRSAACERPWAVASIDLCDVTRRTADSILGLGGFTVDHLDDRYDYGTAFGLEEQSEAVLKMLHAVMNRDEVKPVPGIDGIANILQAARAKGVYTIANTSTLEGCELATIDWLSQHLPGCFDGIVFPRNHDGKGKVTKGIAKQVVIAALNDAAGSDHINHSLHIDDAPHHIHDVRRTAALLALTHADFTPRYKWNEHDTSLNHQPTPLACFEAFDATVRNWQP